MSSKQDPSEKVEQETSKKISDSSKKNNTDIKKSGDLNIFIAKTIYPDASSIFTFRVKSIKEIKDSCFIVPDTNALLLPYTATQESIGEIGKTYRKLRNQNRLRIPAQVGREFAKNRPNKLSELYQQLSKKRNNNIQIPRSKYPLLETLEQYKQLIAIENELGKLIDSYRDTIGNLMNDIRGWSWNDPVSLLYAELFTSDTIVEPELSEDDIKADLQMRNLHNIPPGFRDKSKDDEGIGDLLIWYAILELSKDKDVIFVSGETKPDWWHRSDNQHLYPRYELIEEFRRTSNGKSFHIISLSDLLKLYGAKESIVQEVRQKEAHVQYFDSLPSIRDMTQKVEQAVFAWLIDQFSFDDIQVREHAKPFDFIIEDNGKIIPVDVKFIDSVKHIHVHFADVLSKWDLAKYSKKYNGFYAILVARDTDSADILVDFANDIMSSVNRVPFISMTVFIGYLDVSGAFVAKHSV